MSPQLSSPNQTFSCLGRYVREIRRTYPRMELGQLHILMLVMSQPGLTMADLRAPTELSRSAISRNIQALSEWSYLSSDEGGRRAGLGLVEVMADPRDARSRLVVLSLKGRQLAQRLEMLVSGVL